MSIAAFIDASDYQRDLAIELAVAIAEFSIEENEPLYLLADAVTALEVGMSLIGSREARTVEGGEYRASPIRLLPLISRPNSGDDKALRVKAESDVGGDIFELYSLGLFARRDEHDDEMDFGDEPELALSQAIATVRPKYLVGLGAKSAYWTTISDVIQKFSHEYIPQILMVDGFEPEHVKGRFEKIYVRHPDFTSIRRTERESAPEIDELEELRRAAERDGALVAEFFHTLIRNVRPERSILTR